MIECLIFALGRGVVLWYTKGDCVCIKKGCDLSDACETVLTGTISRTFYLRNQISSHCKQSQIIQYCKTLYFHDSKFSRIHNFLYFGPCIEEVLSCLSLSCQ